MENIFEDYSEGKQRIINAAIRVINEQGIAGATVRRIAQEAGVTTGSIYHHYKNKDEILDDIIKTSIHFAYQAEDLTPEAALEYVREAAVFRVDHVDQQKLYLLMLMRALSEDDKYNEKFKATYSEIIDITSKLSYSTHQNGTEIQNKALASIMVAALDGIAIQQMLGVLPVEPVEMARIFGDFCTWSVGRYLKTIGE